MLLLFSSDFMLDLLIITFLIHEINSVLCECLHRVNSCSRVILLGYLLFFLHGSCCFFAMFHLCDFCFLQFVYF